MLQAQAVHLPPPWHFVLITCLIFLKLPLCFILLDTSRACLKPVVTLARDWLGDNYYAWHLKYFLNVHFNCRVNPDKRINILCIFHCCRIVVRSTTPPIQGDNPRKSIPSCSGNAWGGERGGKSTSCTKLRSQRDPAGRG